MIWDTSIWSSKPCRPSTTRSARGCHPCLRYVLSPMSPGRTQWSFGAGGRIRTADPRITKSGFLAIFQLLGFPKLSNLPVKIKHLAADCQTCVGGQLSYADRDAVGEIHRRLNSCGAQGQNRTVDTPIFRQRLSMCFQHVSESNHVKLWLQRALKSLASNTGRNSISLGPSIGLGQRFTHSTASAMSLTSQSQEPATNSRVSAKGPSVSAAQAVGGRSLARHC